jgi:hypothetical protein
VLISPAALRVYVAGPYSRPDPITNIHAAIKAADVLWAAGFAPVLPHLSGFWDVVSPHPYEEWLALDLAIMLGCNAVYRMPGESSGADKEVAFAQQRGIPIFKCLESLKSWADGRD